MHVGWKFSQALERSVQRCKVWRCHVEQLLKTVNHKVGLLIAVDFVTRSHGAQQVEGNPVGHAAFDGVRQFARRTQNTGTISAQAALLLYQSKLNRVPVQAGKLLARVERMRLQAPGPIGLHVVGKYRVEQQGHMAKQVVKNIGLDNVVKLVWPAYPVCHREFPVGQQSEKRHFGN